MNKIALPSRTAWRQWHVSPPAAKPARQRRARKPSLAGALKQANKAGAKVSGAVLDPSGAIELRFGEPGADDVKPNGNGAYETPEDLRKLI
jgi:hypothetical protein